MSTTDIFASFNDYLTQDHEIREEIRLSVRNLEQTAREMLAVLQGVHQPSGIKEIPSLCKKSRDMFKIVRTQYEDLATKFPSDQYYRFHDHWRFVTQRLTFLAAFTVYLETEKLITREEMSELLGVKFDKGDGLHLDLEDYLMGLLNLASELSRMAVNSVTAGEYSRPSRIATFVGELDSGFRLLNLKNDSLRKRFDGLKYDMKKVEEVVYDVSIRGLLAQDSTKTKEEK
ncbi:translin-like [Saccoglossus kowalevskii]|uniref:Translin n=1 Tax=Saccoglossus kowalevskii TaxID=10224 RepID=A0ABM0GPI4_SACKO|nr:PREDICTED: translin-like [Saccoglossus kowalevskii]